MAPSSLCSRISAGAFLHLYAILFVVEVAMMLAIGVWRPQKELAIRKTAEVDLTPWAMLSPVR